MTLISATQTGCHQLNICLKAYKIKISRYYYFLDMRKWFLFLACFVLKKNQNEVYVCFFENTNSKSCSESRISFALLSLVNFFWCTFIAGFRNNFQNHRRVSEQLLKAQAVIREPEKSSLKRVTGRKVSNFIEASRNFILDFLYKKTTKNCENHKSSFEKYCFNF